MSSKGRGAPVADSEFYPTPAWCTRRILEALRAPLAGHYSALHEQTWLEPCAGDGAITAVLSDNWPTVGAKICGGDIRDIPAPPSVGHWNRAFSFDGYGTHFDAVITNPPFSLAPELIRHFLPRCHWLILLLRASFRLGEWRHNMPDEYKLPQRPEFLASEKCMGHGQDRKHASGSCGWSRKVALDVEPVRACPTCNGFVQRSTSDNSEYSWFVWTPERNRSAGLTRVLPDTPLEERKSR